MIRGAGGGLGGGLGGGDGGGLGGGVGGGGDGGDGVALVNAGISSAAARRLSCRRAMRGAACGVSARGRNINFARVERVDAGCGPDIGAQSLRCSGCRQSRSSRRFVNRQQISTRRSESPQPRTCEDNEV